MSIPGMSAKNQQEKMLGELATQNNRRTETLSLPGIKDLHTRSTDEIAQVLANVIKSRSGIVSIVYNIGENIEITYDSNPYGQLRD